MRQSSLQILEMTERETYLRNKRDSLAKLIDICVSVICIFSGSNSRSLWHLERTSKFWEVDCPQFSEEMFKYNFRMCRNSFNKLCGLVKRMSKTDTNYRRCIPLEKRVAIALYALGSSCEYRNTANLFGVGVSTVGEILIDFCEEVWEQLRPIYMNFFPLQRSTIIECVNGFKQSGFPQCLGALDGCHIEVKPRKEDALDYYNYKGWYSTILLALVDSRYRFLYINVGCPGRCHDSAVFQKSKLKELLENCSLMNEMAVEMNGVNVPIFILADSAFKFSPHVMKPYPFHVNNTEREKRFNYQLSKNRRVVENAFGHLKARFRRIGKGVENRISNVNVIVKACCLLHNFLIDEKDELHPNWLEGNQVFENSQRSSTRSRNSGTEAEMIRTALSLYFEARSSLNNGEEGESVSVGVAMEEDDA